MKSNITLSLDVDLIKQLKQEDNYSDLVNEQIKAYYDVRDVENLRLLQQNLLKTKQILKENRKKERQIKATIEKIKSKEKDILEKTRINIKEKINRDPIKDPDLWKLKGWDQTYPKEWAKHLEFLKGGEKDDN